MKKMHRRATIDILAVAGFATMLMLAGEAVAQATRASEPPPQTASDGRLDRPQSPADAAIAAKVKAALLADGRVGDLGLHVDAKEGIVLLHGTAATQAEVDAARKIALGIEGVREVDVRSVAVGTTR